MFTRCSVIQRHNKTAHFLLNDFQVASIDFWETLVLMSDLSEPAIASDVDSRREPDPLRLISLVTMDREATVGPIITSPRSLFVCERRGVDVETDLALLSMEAALKATRNDRAAAERRLLWWRERRDALLEGLVAEWKTLATRAGCDGCAVAHSTSMPLGGRACDGSGRGDGSPDKRATLCTKVDRVRVVIKANEKKEQRQMNYIGDSRAKYEAYAEAREREEAAREEQKRVAAAIARKKDLDTRDRLLDREQRQAEAERLRLAEQSERIESIEEEAELRQLRLDERREGMREERRVRQRFLRAKQETFTLQATRRHLERVARGQARLGEDARRLDQQREMRAEALALKHEACVQRGEASRRKKEAANTLVQMRSEKVMRRVALREECALARQAAISEVRIDAKVRTARREHERQQAHARADSIAHQRAREVEDTIATTSRRMEDWHAQQDAMRALRVQERALEEQEKTCAVERARRHQAFGLKLVARRADTKEKRIDALRAEQRVMEAERSALRQEMGRAKAALVVPLAAKAPGPLDYDVLASERSLLPNAPVTHIGTSRRSPMMSTGFSHSPGPGHYKLPPVRKTRGAVLPPWGEK